jgi:ketosteroid isomerase-like protein
VPRPRTLAGSPSAPTLGSVAKSNVQLTQESFAAYARGDQEALRELMHPEIEIYAELAGTDS